MGMISLSTSSANQSIPYSASNMPFNATSTFLTNGSNNHNNSNNNNNKSANTLSSSTKVKCTRSKSQPVFNKDNYHNSNHIMSSMQTSESQKNSLLGCSSFKGNTSNTNSTLMQNKNLTSSPICNYDLLPAERESNCNNAHMNGDNLQNDSSNPESSFYEDQLDNELESFSDSTAGLTVRSAEMSASFCNGLNGTNSNRVVKIISNELDAMEQLTSKSNSDMTAKMNGIKSIQNTKTKSGNSNHHVSFNINNAIYTSRQETPIPISILKQSNNSNNGCNSNSNNNNNIINGNNKSILANTTNSSNSTFDSFLDCNKKSPTICSVNNEKERILNGNKSVRNDTKTTIL